MFFSLADLSFLYSDPFRNEFKSLGNLFPFLYIQVEEKLSVRLQAGLRAWTDHLEDYKEDTSKPEFDSDTNPLDAHKPGGDPEIKVTRILYLSHTCTIIKNDIVTHVIFVPLF